MALFRFAPTLESTSFVRLSWRYEQNMIEDLKKKLKSLAIADAIIEPEWEYRYFSYTSQWGPNEEMASMRDGSGGHWFVLFEPDKVAYKCISPDDGLIKNIDEIENQIPIKHQNFIHEPAFYAGKVTSIWILERNEWFKFGIPNIQYLVDLEQVIDWGPSEYKTWAEDYYEKDLDLSSLKQLFEHEITEKIINTLNPAMSYQDLKDDLYEIGISS